MNLSQAISKVLKGSGVNYLFGIPGGGSSADLMNTSEDEGIKFILIADEDGVVCIPAEALAATLEKLKIIFEVEEAMEKAIASCAPVEEIKAIIAKKKPKK